MYFSEIKPLSVENGPGVRVSLFVSGCRNHCKGCFQPETWDFCFGQPYTAETEQTILSLLGAAHVSGLTILGGDPFEEENQIAVLGLLRSVKRVFPSKSIWVYTGYLLDKDLVPGGRKYTDCTNEMLSLIDVLVDGPFIESQKSSALAFRGSSNQRILDVGAFLKENEIKILSLDN